MTEYLFARTTDVDAVTATAAKIAAQAAAAAAVISASTASSAATAAQTAQGLAETAQGLAEAAQLAAENAQTAAEAAQTAAETAQGLAEDARDAAIVAQLASEAAAASALQNIVEDLTPQLGGNLDLNGHVITGLEIGVNVQAYDADLTTWAGLAPSANAQSLVTAADYAAMRTLLDLVVGTNVQAYDADLTTWAGLTPSANAQSLVTAADYAAMRALLDLEAGTDFNAYSAALAAYPDPTANDADSLGTGTVAWSDLFLASGGVVNFANGDVTLSHVASNQLRVDGGIFLVAEAIYTTGTGGAYFLHRRDTDANAWALYSPAGNLHIIDIGGGGIDKVIISASALYPATNDALTLGASTLAWADLFLAAGGIINWNNGGITIGEEGDYLAFRLAAGYGFNTDVFPLTNDTGSLGLSTNGWSDLYLAAGAVINWNNGDVLLTHGTDELALTGHTSLVLGYTTGVTLTAGQPSLQVHGLTTAGSVMANYRWSGAVAGGAGYSFVKSRGATAGTRGAVAADDQLGFLAFQGDDGTNFITGANIVAEVDGTPGTNDMPGRILIKTTADGASSPTERMRVTSVGNIKIAGSANRGTTEGTNHIDIFDGTAPAGTLANGCSFYSTSGEMRVMDAAGNATLLSPHDKDTNEWIYHSVDTRTGRGLRIDMERMMRALDKKLGGGFIREFDGHV